MCPSPPALLEQVHAPFRLSSLGFAGLKTNTLLLLVVIIVVVLGGGWYSFS